MPRFRAHNLPQRIVRDELIEAVCVLAKIQVRDQEPGFAMLQPVAHAAAVGAERLRERAR